MNQFKHKERMIFGALALLVTSTTHSASITSDIFNVSGAPIGKVIFEDSEFGLLIKPQLSGLPAGIRGFHIHQHSDCGNHARNAGGHLDPAATNSHQGPYGKGHLGDLPVLVVETNGMATTPTLAPRLKTQDIKGHSIMIHEGGDNYRDTPPLGGGGARIACGKIPS